ncbi:PREDICTED: cadherin EGF LAG seven-pass G-type receptor 1-like isoform X2 [Priapulus caudatus]|uniref:Cadherin EGF LAG seven-pass G-type receptor 1-like isoform X2 n=1 Tax=Priapulus caudatus TaxID=37621 RepID=A0ABM1EUM4_PRICU|nr:PREDICTED: cadherin EGF LAG seven-pass G-type receptor 1-like isoform X2 [Priapulus caudatus]
MGFYTLYFIFCRSCWLSTEDSLIWSFVGPVCAIVAMNIVTLILAMQVMLKSTKTDMEYQFSIVRTGLKLGVILLPLLGTTMAFGLLAVNRNINTFHYLFAIFTLFQGLSILIFHCLFNKRVRVELSRQWARCRGQEEEFDDVSPTGSRAQRSALAYHNHALDGLQRINIGVSTTSTTSHSTGKTESLTRLYRPDGGATFGRSTSTSTSGQLPSVAERRERPPGGAGGGGALVYQNNNVSAFHNADTGEVCHPKQQRNRHHAVPESDSELSDADLELASSHSSDEEEEEEGEGVVEEKPKNDWKNIPTKPGVAAGSGEVGPGQLARMYGGPTYSPAHSTPNTGLTYPRTASMGVRAGEGGVPPVPSYRQPLQLGSSFPRATKPPRFWEPDGASRVHSPSNLAGSRSSADGKVRTPISDIDIEDYLHKYPDRTYEAGNSTVAPPRGGSNYPDRTYGAGDPTVAPPRGGSNYPDRTYGAGNPTVAPPRGGSKYLPPLMATTRSRLPLNALPQNGAPDSDSEGSNETPV